MGTEEPKDLLKRVDWNAVGKKACIGGGIGAGMLAEMWMNEKDKEDGGVQHVKLPALHYKA